MVNRSASLAMSTSNLKALPGKLDIKRHSPGILYVFPLKLVLPVVFFTKETKFSNVLSVWLNFTAALD